MNALPNADRAILDLNKLERYCLDPTHPRGKHKARVFQHALGVGQRDAHWLRSALLVGLANAEAEFLSSDAHGDHWRVDIPISRHEQQGVVRTIWIVRNLDSAPRLVTCWVL